MSFEHNCQIVNSRGIVKSCNHYNQKDYENGYLDREYVDLDIPDKIKNNDTLYISNYAIVYFIEKILPRINKFIILVSGDSDNIIPNTYPQHTKIILDNPYIIHWFSQNCIIEHPKLTRIPIGMDYHTLYHCNTFWGSKQTPVDQENDILSLCKNSKPFYERNLKIYTTFHFELYRGDRVEAFNSISKNLIDYEPTKTTRIESHRKQLNYSFVASPFGGGPDCHRTWEALSLGCIPIIKSSGLDHLFQDLPVLLVKKWSDITEELLSQTVEKFKNTKYEMTTMNNGLNIYTKLTLKYWMNLISSKKILEENIIIAGVCKNIEKYFERVKYNILQVASRFRKYKIIIVENDSKDNTRKLLQTWSNLDKNVNLITFDNLMKNAKNREQVIAFCRNVYLQHIDNFYKEDYPYTLVVDMDNAFACDSFSVDGFLSNIDILNNNPKIAALSAVPKGSYYDIFALRNKGCNYNCWKMVLGRDKNMSYDDAVKKYVIPHTTDYSIEKNLIQVDSAFGGATIYRTNVITQCEYKGNLPNGESECEHIIFNQYIRNLGYEIYLNPKFQIFEREEFQRLA